MTTTTLTSSRAVLAREAETTHNPYVTTTTDRAALPPQADEADHLVPLRPIHMIDLSALRLGADAGSPFVRTRAELIRVLVDGQTQGIPAFTVVTGDTIVGLLLFEQVYCEVTRSARMSVWIDQGHRSRGIGTTAVRQGLARAARSGLHRIEAAVLPENAAGRRMLTRAGFTPIGLARELLLVDGQWRDHVLYEYLIGDE